MKQSKKRSMFRPKRSTVSVDVKFRDKKEVYSIRVGNLTRDDLKLSQEPAKWEKIPISKNLILLRSRATRQTEFSEIGDVVFMLKFRDGRTVRFYKNDISNRAWFRLKRVLLSSK